MTRPAMSELAVARSQVGGITSLRMPPGFMPGNALLPARIRPAQLECPPACPPPFLLVSNTLPSDSPPGVVDVIDAAPGFTGSPVPSLRSRYFSPSPMSFSPGSSVPPLEPSRHRPSGAGGHVRRRPVDVQQLHLEDQRAAGRDLPLGLVAVPLSGAMTSLRMPPLHARDADLPALDHRRSARSLDRLALLLAGVEHGAVRQPAGVVHLHLRARRARLAGRPP